MEDESRLAVMVKLKLMLGSSVQLTLGEECCS